MSTSPSLPPKEDVAKATGLLASTLTNDMQTAAVKKARELGFDLARGRISLDETLINLSNIRDLLLGASETGKLVHLPLKLQYTLYAQTQKVAETLTALVNGTDAIQALEDVVDDLTASAWQYNLHNLSDQVLGFQQKMNQLKAQETLISQVHREAQEFTAAATRARQLLQELEDAVASAKERGNAINATLEQSAGTFAKTTETEQRIAGLAIQAEQHDAAAAKHEANAKAASATAETIADKLPTIYADLETAKTTLGELNMQAKSIMTSFEQSSSKSLADFQQEHGQLKTTAESAIHNLQNTITQQAETLQAAAEKLRTDTSGELETLQRDQTAKLDAHRDTINKQARETIDTLSSQFQTTLTQQNETFDAQRTKAQNEQDHLVAELNTLEGQIKDSIRRATGFTLFHSFQTRQEELVNSKNFWARALAGVVLISVALSIGFIIYVSSLQTFGPAFYLKLSISLPIIYAIWFCTVQYARERRLEEEYAFKSSISISLDPYRELIEKLVTKDDPAERAKYTAFIIESVGRVFTSPMETVFDHAKDATPAEGMIKAVGELTKDLLKLVKKV